MVIDICFFILVATALFKGYNRGFIVAIFSFIAVIIGMAAALKFSAVTANWLAANANIKGTWLPFIAFAITFIGFVVAIRFAANLLQKTVEFMLMGWVNKLGGMLLYIGIYTLAFSVLLFFINSLQLLKPATILQSFTYSYIQPLGPWVINSIGSIVPLFSNLFLQLQTFFDGLKTNVAIV
jgi:membrane protein required for colicin V production